jgi:hypothetical protein
MRTLTLDLSALQVETFTTRPTPSPAYAEFAGTVEADCDTESGPPDCETAGADCETFDCTDPPMCGEPTEDC